MQQRNAQFIIFARHACLCGEELSISTFCRTESHWLLDLREPQAVNSTNPCKTVYPLRQSPQSALRDQQPEVMENMKYLDPVYSFDSLLHCSQPLLGPICAVLH